MPCDGVNSWIGCKSPRLTGPQKDLAGWLREYGTGVADAYLGALHALQHEEYPDRLVHFAHSLREVIDQLARLGRPAATCPKISGQKDRSKALARTFDPIGQQRDLCLLCDQLAKQYGELSSIAHHNPPPDKLAREILSDVEELLRTLTPPQPGINDEIIRMLKELPSQDAADRLVALSIRQADQALLAKTAPPAWLPYVRTAGFFKNPLPASRNPTPRWEPAKYLHRCAPDFPDDVTDIILSCRFIDADLINPAVCMDFLACAISLPAACAEKIGRKSIREEWHRFHGLDQFASKYVEAATALYRAGEYDVSADMLFLALRPESPARRRAERDADKIARTYTILPYPLGEYLFEKTMSQLPAIAEQNPLPMADLLDRLLHEHIVAQNRIAGISRDTGNWRPAVEDSDQNMETAQSLLLSCFRDCIARAVKSGQGAQAMRICHRRNLAIYRRLELHVYARHPSEFKREVELCALLYCGDLFAFHEYYHLLKAVFPSLSDFTKRRLLESIAGGCRTGKSGAPARGGSCADLPQDVSLRYLEAIDGHLSAEHRRTYDFGERVHIVRPDYMFYATDFADVDVNSDLFDGKIPDEVFETAKNRAPPHPLAPADAVAETFGKYAEKHPAESSARALLLVSADPRIQYELFHGLYRAVQKGGAMEWDGLLPVIKEIVSHRSCTQRRAHPVEEAMPGTLDAIKSSTSRIYDPALLLCQLVKAGLEKDSLGIGARSAVWGIIEALADLRTDDVDPAEVYTTNSLDLSERSVGGMSFHLICQYAAWRARSGRKRELAPEVKRVFDQYLDGNNHSVSRNAVFGVFLRNFYSLDREWTRSMLKRISRSKETKIAFWDGYVSWDGPHAGMFGDLLKWYDEFMNGRISKNSTWRSFYKRTVLHAMVAYFCDWDGADEIVCKFLKNAAGESAKICVEEVNEILRLNDGDPDFNGDKLVRLWNLQQFELHDLGPWFENTPLDAETSISVYRDYLKRRPGRIQTFDHTIAELCRYAADFSLEAAECLGELINKCDNYILEDARAVLRLLRESQDPNVKKACESIQAKLARMGHDWRDAP